MRWYNSFMRRKKVKETVAASSDRKNTQADLKFVANQIPDTLLGPEAVDQIVHTVKVVGSQMIAENWAPGR
jgi:hypothetical protein